jgi:hypothetical protein
VGKRICGSGIEVESFEVELRLNKSMEIPFRQQPVQNFELLGVSIGSVLNLFYPVPFKT